MHIFHMHVVCERSAAVYCNQDNKIPHPLEWVSGAPSYARHVNTHIHRIQYGISDILSVRRVVPVLREGIVDKTYNNSNPTPNPRPACTKYGSFSGKNPAKTYFREKKTTLIFFLRFFWLFSILNTAHLFTGPAYTSGFESPYFPKRSLGGG